ncbi:YciI family protein [Ectobacillus sp. sgz5001026]|uniref:YciI family protein n=1 Tax=Ectobacillus sp. sgz5001026 TaxID=3242473 RepID=UPI0036D41BEB
MFFALLTYKTSLERVDEYLEEHKHYLDKNYQLGNFIFSGRRNPRIGGVILINQSSKEQVMNIIAEDPFYEHEIAEYELIEFTPSKYDEKFNVFLK